MKRPEKKKTSTKDSFDSEDYQVPIEVEAYNQGYNQACDDWEKFLPNEEEIEKIIRNVSSELNDYACLLSREISKRLRGKK